VVDANVLTYDFGYAQPAGLGSIGDTVWKDRNQNGVFDPGERTLSNVTVSLSGDTNNDGQPDVTATAVTDSNGHYLFSELPAGTYTVSIVAPPLILTLRPTYDFDGIDTPHVATLTLQAGENNLEVDFGYWMNRPPKPPHLFPRPSDR
jgi:hypothetical protein